MLAWPKMTYFDTKLVTVGEAEGLFEASVAGRPWQKMMFFRKKYVFPGIGHNLSCRTQPEGC